MNYKHCLDQPEAARTFDYAEKFFKEHAKGPLQELPSKQLEEVVEQDYVEDTKTKPFVIPRIRIQLEQQQTKRDVWAQGISSLDSIDKKLNNKKKANADMKKKMQAEVEPPVLEIPYNKRVQEIMMKKPLRERLSSLLPAQLQLPISFDHHQLLKRMEIIDRAIQFLGTHRNVRIFFFQEIKRNIYQNNSIVIEYKTIQQLLFLDEKCYGVEWKMNQNNKRYDLKITLPKIQSMDLRKSEMRKKIVKYLIYKEGEFLAEKKLPKIENHKWHELFEYKKIGIPLKSLPVHPNRLDIDIRAHPDEQIQKLDNSNLKMVMKNKKEVAEIKSISAASVADMIFSKVPANQISSQILAMVREKERRNNEEMQRKKAEDEKIDKEAMLKIFEEILLIYMSKNVCNIFKVTLIELLQQRLRFKDDIISKYVHKLLALPGLELFKIVESSKKIEVIQINKQKVKTARALIQSSF